MRPFSPLIFPPFEFKIWNPMEKICVAVRLRPPVSAASDDGGSDGLAHWRVDDNTVSLCKTLGTPIAGASYTFGEISILICCFWENLQRIDFEFSLFGFIYGFDFGYNFFFVVVVDHVFDQECDNERVYDLLAKDIIRAAVDGFNGIFWYFLTYFFWVIIIFFLYMKSFCCHCFLLT